MLLLLLLGGLPGRAQVLVGATPFGPVFSGLQPAVADTALLLVARARRVGLSTFVQTTGARGYLRLGPRQQLRYRLGTDMIYDSRGTPPFVREDYGADVAHVFTLDAANHWQLGQQIHYDQSRANGTRSGLWLGRLGYQRRLRPGHATDSLSQMRLTVLGGLATDRRNGRDDAGVAYGFDAAAIYFANGPAAPPLAVRVLGTRAVLGPRTMQRLVAEAIGEQAFLPNAPLTVQGRLGYRTNCAEDYLLGSVQRIQSDTVAAQAGASYRINAFTTLRSDNSVLLPTRAFLYRRQADAADTLQDVGYRQRELDTRQELRYARPQLQATVAFSYRERTRAYYLDNSRNLSVARLATALAREQVKDITEQTTLWQSTLTWLPTARHALALLGSAQLLRVDAPSKDNQQTRDEAQHMARLTWTGRWAGAFRTTLGVAGEYRQTVFIRAGLSAENYADRLLHWEPGFTWAPGKLSIRSYYHLWVSYQVRDRASEQARNRASRVLEQTQSISYQLRPRLLLLADYVRRENRVGQLNWAQFRESPLDTSVTHDFTLGARQSWAGLRGSTSLRLGYRLLEQRNYGRAALLLDDPTGPATTLIFLHNVTRQHGPEVAVERRATAGFNVSASVWLQWLRTFSTYTTGSGTFIGSSYTALDLARETSRVLPYFELTAEWRVGRR
ncbi:hypothetical protein I2I05_16575 [Hymenobacter sp. BT683]|uniref:TonB-dependent receptor n=1 Tax=Hymenobacter jeongseonensis TaxID=2791027 RepID=A0ABS0IKX1_9BACT|nr:hypothetical protein [Hymenobacter jeongseonensis]MBF9239019.1 hypothetical protein [Hymenobacter jeongseonensis]